jgi:hypothetical protein
MCPLIQAPDLVDSHFTAKRPDLLWVDAIGANWVILGEGPLWLAVEG